MTLKNGAIAPSNTRANGNTESHTSEPRGEHTRAATTLRSISTPTRGPSLAHAQAAKKPVPGSEPTSAETTRIDHSATDLIAHYQRLPKTDPIHKFVAARLNNLLTDITIDRQPELIILARRGFGINACATKDGAIVIAPEMLSFLKYVEELDFVLLHEIEHLARGHFNTPEDQDTSIVQSAGQSRISEYDADLSAFLALAHPQRNSSPMGAITALERFNQEAPTAWDIAHGALVDRIMNLKWFTLFRDLSTDGAVPGESGSLSKPLRSMPKFIAETVDSLSEGSRVQSLLRRPPLDRGYDQYRAELREAVRASETSSLRWALPSLLEDLDKLPGSTASAGFLRQSYQEALVLSFSKLIEEVTKASDKHGLTQHMSERLLGLELMLGGVTPERIKKNLTGPLQKRVLNALNQFKDSLSSHAGLEEVSQLLSLVDGNLDPNQTKSFLFTVARITLVDNCLFDEDEDGRIDINGYLSHFNGLVSTIAPLSASLSNEPVSCETSLNTQVFLQLATHLIDIESPQVDEAVLCANERDATLLGDPASMSMSMESLKDLIQNEALFTKLQAFSRDKLRILSVEESCTRLSQLFRGIEPIISQITDPAEAPAALDQIERCFQDAYQISKQLPSTIHGSSLPSITAVKSGGNRVFTRQSLIKFLLEEEIRSDGTAIERARFDHGARLMILKAGLLHALCATAEEREAVSTKIDEDLSLAPERFEALIEVMTELRSERPEALIRKETLPPRHGDPSATIGIHETIFESLYDELINEQSPLPSERVLERLYTFVTSTAIAKPDENSLRPPHLEIMALGERALREVYPSDRTSEQFLKHALAVSFFDPNQASARPIQRELVLRLIDTMGAQRAAHELFERFRPQRQWHSLESLERLDETANTVDEIKNVAKLSKEHLLSTDRIADRAGALVIGDLIMSKAARWDSFDFLFTGLSSAQDDSRLTNMISQRWWSAQTEKLLHPLRGETLPEPFHFETAEEDRNDARNFVENVAALTPATFFVEHALDEGQFSTPATITAHTVRAGLYGLGMAERLVVLRKLANEPSRGVLISPERRVRVADGLLNMMLAQSQSDRLTELSSQAFRALFRAVPADDLGIALTPMLLDHFLRAPQTSASFRPYAREKAHRFLEEFGWEENDLDRTPRSIRAAQRVEFHREAHAEVSGHIEWALSGRDPRTQRSVSESVDNLMSMCGITLSDHKSLSRRGPIPFILDFSRNLQTPGTRALQLLGGVVELPPEIEREFLQVYDARKGQSKQSALNTIEKVLPPYAATLHSLKRIGGGALYSVFLADLKNGGREVIRVANPNPEYHTRRILHSMRAAQALLARENGEFAVGAHVINLVDEWISSELKDSTFESDDKSFRKTWNHWRADGKCPLSIYIPESQPTGSLLVRREEFIPGRNFTELDEIYKENPALARNAVALALQHYLAQMRGSFFGFGTALVHSDISPGNLRLMEGGKVAILDRSMYLKFSLTDRSIIKEMRDAKSNRVRASVMVEGLAGLQGRKISPAERARITERVIEALDGSGSHHSAFMKGFLTAQKEGLMVPLRFQLLVKNLNSFRVMAQKVGFATLQDAQNHTWGK